MVFYIFSFILFIIVNICFGFNVDTLSPILYIDRNNNNNYFGYSIALYPKSNEYTAGILIGAPRRKDENNLLHNGALFNCGIHDKCTIFDFKSIHGNNSWIGSSIDVNHENGRAVACASRTPLSTRVNNGLIGGCYFFNLDKKSQMKYISPLDNKTHYADNKYPYNFITGQAGISAHVATDKDEIIIGAPGVYGWEGSSILCRNQKNKDFTCKTVASGKKICQDLGYSLTSALLGYSTSSIHYKGKQLKYISGAPRKLGLGYVYIYDFLGYYKGLSFSGTFHGVKLGEYFGASVTTGDTDNDGLEDLIVGSPFYSDKNYNEGRIYYFNGRNYFRDKSKNININGYRTGGQFGTCVQYLGDLDHDGFGDVAVAAPYEADSGVVYIFRGCSEGLDFQYSQRIVGKDINSHIRGFGYSISRTADIDSNNYLDLAIGAYKSGHSVILRTRPTVAILHTLTTKLPTINDNQTTFDIQVCFKINYPQALIINISRSITIDNVLKRARLSNSSKIATLLINNAESCENLTVSLTSEVLQSNTKYENIPINIALSHNMLYGPIKKGGINISQYAFINNDTFNTNGPIYDKYQSSKNTSIDINFNLDCGDDKICDTNLSITFIAPKLKNNTFIVNSADHILFETTISNSGENSYSTKLDVIIPENITFTKIPSTCQIQKNTTIMECNIDSPLRQNAKASVVLSLDMNRINSDQVKNSINITAIASSNGKNLTSNNFLLQITRDANCTIKSRSQQYNKYITLSKNEHNISHQYQIEKSGISYIQEMLIEFYIPTSKKANNFIILNTTKGLFSGVKYNCETPVVWSETVPHLVPSKDLDLPDINCNTPEVICTKLVCWVGPIRSKTVVVPINLQMEFNAILVKNLFESRKIAFTTLAIATISKNSGRFLIEETPSFVSVSSIFLETTQSIPWWLFLVAGCLGLLLLFCLVGGLLKAGFFKRETKQKLEEQKTIQEVIQEIRQSLTINSEDIDKSLNNTN